MRSTVGCSLQAILLLSGVLASFVWAEQVEIVTYYPQPASAAVPDPLYVNRVAVGSAYNGSPPPPNGLLVQGRLGVGTVDPRLPIQVVGEADGGGILLQYASVRWSFASSSPRRNEGEFSLYRGGTAADGVLTLRRYAPDHTILKIWSPPAILGSSPNPTTEATLSLVRGEEPNVEYVDFYNNGYAVETQFGIRIQKRGAGQYRDFVFDQWDGVTKTPLLVLSASRNVGVGRSSPAGKLHVAGDAGTTWNNHLVLTNARNEAAGILFDAANRDWAIAATNPASAMGDQKFVIYDATAASVRLAIDAVGNVGVGKSDPAYLLDVNGKLGIRGTRTLLLGADASANHWIMVGGDTEGTHNALGFNAGSRLIFAGAGWTTAASVKSFMIDHPLDPEHKYLFHSTLEGPEVGVYYRGEGRLIDGGAVIELPPYFDVLTCKEGRTVLLTPKFIGVEPISMLAASTVARNQFSVRALDRGNPSQEFYWEVKAVRADVNPLQVEVLKAELGKRPANSAASAT